MNSVPASDSANPRTHPLADSPTRELSVFESVFVWTGGVLFVSALAFGAGCYLLVWRSPFRDVLIGQRIVHERGGWTSFAINTTLFGLFAAHHSILARASVKSRFEAYVPPRLQRSAYVWIASVLFILVC